MRFLGYLIIVTLVVFLLMEGALRALPRLIPFEFLIGFNEDLRGRIAERLGLATLRDSRLVDRDDEGPTLRVFKPGEVIKDQFGDPGAVDVMMDENGFCNPSENAMPEAGPIDLLFIGDSFTWCTSVAPERSWPSLVHEMLGISSYDLAVPGTGPYEHVQILKAFGLSKEPKVVVMGIYEGNDLRDSDVYWEHRTNGPSAEEECGTEGLLCSLYTGIKGSLLGRVSYSLNLALEGVRKGKSVLIELMTAADPYEGPHFLYTITGSGEPVSIDHENGDVDEPEYASLLKNDTVKLSIIDDALTIFKDLADEHGFTPVLVYLPAAYTAYASEVSFENSEYGTLMDDYSMLQRAYYAATSERLGIVFLDATPALQEVASEHATLDTLLYFPRNVHFTAVGHQIVADEIAPFLASLFSLSE